jgi:C7-cyclitol 7-kinase
MSAVVVDLGGTHLRCAVADQDGIRGPVERVRVQGREDALTRTSAWDVIVSTIKTFAGEARSTLSPADPVVIAFPGPIRDHREILSAPTIQDDSLPIPDLSGEIERLTGRRVLLLNDISAAAWAISEDLALERFSVVTVSSGIGSKLFDRRHPDGVLDAPPYAGEIGHIVVDSSPTAPLCGCGGRGHLGAISSGRGVEALARRRAAEDPGAFARSECCRRFGARDCDLTNERHLVPAVLAGDDWALSVVAEATRPLARSLLTVVSATGAGKVVVIGGFAHAISDRYLEVLKSEMLLSSQYHILEPHLASLLALGPRDSCLRGAAVFARRGTV